MPPLLYCRGSLSVLSAFDLDGVLTVAILVDYGPRIEIYCCVQTVLTAALSATVLGQMLSLRDTAAMVIILAGVACVIAAKLSEQRAKCVDAGIVNWQLVI